MSDAVSRSHASHGAEKSSPPVGFDRGDGDCPYGFDRLDEAIAWHDGYRAALKWMMEDSK